MAFWAESFEPPGVLERDFESTIDDPSVPCDGLANADHLALEARQPAVRFLQLGMNAIEPLVRVFKLLTHAAQLVTNLLEDLVGEVGRFIGHGSPEPSMREALCAV